MKRRTLFSTVAATISTVPALGMGAGGGVPTLADVDPHLQWAAERTRCLAEAKGAEAATADRFLDRAWELRDLIVDTPAATVAGALAQASLLAEMHEGEIGLDESDGPALPSIRDVLLRLSRAGVA